jgi:hypothetical protein
VWPSLVVVVDVLGEDPFEVSPGDDKEMVAGRDGREGQGQGG